MIDAPRKIDRLYEINTATYLDKLSRDSQTTVTLASIPDKELDRIAGIGADAVWMMGVWNRSQAAVDISLHDESLLSEVNQILPDFRNEDMIGSAYAISSYQVDKRFGGETELTVLRRRLADRGMRLILDFIPNHTAFDHEWIEPHPDYYIQGTPQDLAQRQSEFHQSTGNTIVARGRDPYYTPWPDVAQLNAFASGYRNASIQTLQRLAEICDGVRCDMAMLVTTDIFASTWGERTGPIPSTEYWSDVIPAVRKQFDEFVFIAECYWDTQQLLLDQGFDYCYDKDLYDKLVSGTASDVAAQLDKLSPVRDHMVHFLENHDERRAAQVLPPDRHKAAAYIASTLPGLLLLHDGQLTGYPDKVPVHIGRAPSLEPDVNITSTYSELLLRPKNKLDWKLSADNSNVLVGSSINTGQPAALINFGSHETELGQTLAPWQIVEL